MSPLWVEALGWVGSAVFLVGLYLVSFGWIDGEGRAFNILMLTQSVIFVVYSYTKDAKPYVFVEFVVGIIALVALWRDIQRRRADHSDDT